ncbi:hypothetical protein COU74_02990 [Candidatus Peregrinibacteria bacterium CG10_big_fil_rev_8_21_14_0_10_36_19]|nr:MAG: hypothetical protein COU74_02990 [Candidatus Peregrinibacteria bacterium CG10_big_fil_rev_8_21_14_0_10_36_19]
MGIYDAAKDAAKVLKEAGKIDEYQKILDLIDDLFEKRDRIEKLQKDNVHLKKQLETQENYFFENNSYWHKDNKDGPFCSRCFDKSKDLIRTIPTYINSNFSKCPECKNTVNFTGKEDPSISFQEENFDPYSPI